MMILPIEDEAAQRALTAMLLDALCKDIPASFVSQAEKQMWLDMAVAQQRICEHLRLPDVQKNFVRLHSRLREVPIFDPVADFDEGSYSADGWLQ